MLALESLKLESGTLFLSSYRLPDVDEVKNVIAALDKLISKKKFEALCKIISDTHNQESLSMFFSNNDFIGYFN